MQSRLILGSLELAELQHQRLLGLIHRERHEEGENAKRGDDGAEDGENSRAYRVVPSAAFLRARF